MSTIYFVQYPLLSLIMWGNKNQTLSISLMREASLSAPGWAGGSRAGQMVGKAPSAVGVSGGSRGLSFSLRGCLLTITLAFRARGVPTPQQACVSTLEPHHGEQRAGEPLLAMRAWTLHSLTVME